MKFKTILLASLAVLSAVSAADAQNGKPVVGGSARYCNPLPMEIGNGGNASGDVSVLEWQGKYYMFCTGGGAWVSTDMLNWKFHKVEHVPVAPDVAQYKGQFYMTGNSTGLWVANNPLGPYEMQEFKDLPPLEEGWNGAFDTHIFVDDDDQPYLFWSGRGISGIYACKLDSKDLSRFVGPAHHLATFNGSHVWERYGEMNEYQGVAWIEGPWVYKHDGTYYLQYSASGTQWKSYAGGYYTAKNILGPYTYAANNPLIYRADGMVTGTAHGSMLTGPDGGIWQFYTTVLSSPPGGRRIGMDRVYIDKNGLLVCKVTDTPQWAPGVKADPAKLDRGDSESVPVTVNKINAMNSLSKFSSEIPGFYASYATDNYSGTVWQPAADDAQPYIMIDLSPATRFDVVETFTVDGLRLMFGAPMSRGMGMGFGRRGEFTPTIYKYKLEVSDDGEHWKTALDKSNSTDSKNTLFEEIPPVECRFVKLTILDWPKTAPFGIIEFTVFGKPASMGLPAVAIPTTADVVGEREI